MSNDLSTYYSHCFSHRHLEAFRFRSRSGAGAGPHTRSSKKLMSTRSLGLFSHKSLLVYPTCVPDLMLRWGSPEHWPTLNKSPGNCRILFNYATYQRFAILIKTRSIVFYWLLLILAIETIKNFPHDLGYVVTLFLPTAFRTNCFTVCYTPSSNRHDRRSVAQSSRRKRLLWAYSWFHSRRLSVSFSSCSNKLLEEWWQEGITQ